LTYSVKETLLKKKCTKSRETEREEEEEEKEEDGVV